MAAAHGGALLALAAAHGGALLALAVGPHADCLQLGAAAGMHVRQRCAPGSQQAVAAASGHVSLLQASTVREGLVEWV